MKILFPAFALLLCIVGCRSTEPDEETAVFVEPLQETIPEDTNYVFDLGTREVEVRVQFPDSNWRGTLILLQGWNFPNTDWCEKSTVCAKALNAGYALVCPDMGKSIYALRNYPETRKDWADYPTRTWVNEALIPFLLEQKIIDPKKMNAALGLSTGARGALFLALDHPNLFDAVACLSGDYDQREAPQDNLYRGFFGAMTQFPERWAGDENPISRLKYLKADLYLAHGKEDQVVDARHTERLCELVTQVRKECHLEENYAHDYRFWDTQVDPVLRFFSEAYTTYNK